MRSQLKRLILLRKFKYLSGSIRNLQATRRLLIHKPKRQDIQLNLDRYEYVSRRLRTYNRLRRVFAKKLKES